MKSQIFLVLVLIFVCVQGHAKKHECVAPVAEASTADRLRAKYPSAVDSAIYDTSLGSDPITPDSFSTYLTSTFMNIDTKKAITHFYYEKDFDDGTLDIFVPIRVGEPDLSVELGKIYWILRSFGGYGVNHPLLQRKIRIFPVESSPDPTRKAVLALQVIEYCESLSKEFGFIPIEMRYWN